MESFSLQDCGDGIAKELAFGTTEEGVFITAGPGVADFVGSGFKSSLSVSSSIEVLRVVARKTVLDHLVAVRNDGFHVGVIP